MLENHSACQLFGARCARWSFLEEHLALVLSWPSTFLEHTLHPRCSNLSSLNHQRSDQKAIPPPLSEISLSFKEFA